jgi:hypothetical protein
MSSLQLVRHPGRYPTESLPGYVLRLSEKNGYASPRDLYRLAGMTSTETSLTSFAFPKIAAISKQPSSELRKCALNPNSRDSREFYLLGRRISAAYLNLTGARVCAECVQEKGFIEVHWHLDLMVACPIHARTAAWFCTACRTRLSWDRAGLLTCKCGAPITGSLREAYSETELLLLDLIRQKAIGGALHREFNWGAAAQAQLAGGSLQSLLSLIRILGEQSIRSRRSFKRPLGRNLLKAAASLLEDWPLKFSRHLSNIYPQTPGHEKSTPCLDSESVRLAISDRFELRRKNGAASTRSTSL